MPVGKYRLDVSADGKPWKSTAFTVVEVAKAPDVKKPEDLLPLRQGRSGPMRLCRSQAKARSYRCPV